MSNSRKFNKLSTLALLPGLLMLGQANANSYFTDSVNDNIVESGDLLTVLLPATGLFASWMHDDAEGAKQIVYSTATTQIIINSAKNTVGRKRPNGSGWKSFPSGHAGGAFSGAAFLQTRYGSSWGIPAYALATATAASRIHGNRHYAGDVLGGASIAFLVNQYFVSPYHVPGVSFNAAKTEDGLSIGVTLTGEAFDNEREQQKAKPVEKPLKHRFEFGVGANLADSSGELFANEYLSNSTIVDDIQPFAYVKYQYEIADHQSLEIEFSPNETRRTGTVAKAFDVDGNTFNSGEEVYTAYQHWMLGANLYKGFDTINKFDFKVGMGLYAHRFGFVAEKANVEDSTASEEYWRLMPSFTLKGAYSITDQLSAVANTQYQVWSGDNYFLAEAGVNYQINRAWEVGMKYGYSQTQLKNNIFNSKYSGDLVTLNFVNRF
ncbi:phosphatase PAP2 family protein [Vibrio sp. 10N.261.55.A7]|uniref:phosphatase PAP2 family protein n=1 Tax=Vibrio sp. 10N.261.55.A7 TaxID=1880851 RepID=UPI000C8537B4|nr:phosphatase PAP2 family protein [Vibrio sp. 10N.261.55.A7]PMK02142.1 hypothetical protein BCU12_02895 [Vibrio sp. 10N.261.55.A7]